MIHERWQLVLDKHMLEVLVLLQIEEGIKEKKMMEKIINLRMINEPYWQIKIFFQKLNEEKLNEHNGTKKNELEIFTIEIIFIKMSLRYSLKMENIYEKQIL